MKDAQTAGVFGEIDDDPEDDGNDNGSTPIEVITGRRQRRNWTDE